MDSRMHPDPLFTAVRHIAVGYGQHIDRQASATVSDHFVFYIRRFFPSGDLFRLPRIGIRQKMGYINRIPVEYFIYRIRIHVFRGIETSVLFSIVRIKRPYRFRIFDMEKHLFAFHSFHPKMVPTTAGCNGRIDRILGIGTGQNPERYDLQRIARAPVYPNGIEQRIPAQTSGIELCRYFNLRKKRGTA